MTDPGDRRRRLRRLGLGRGVPAGGPRRRRPRRPVDRPSRSRATGCALHQGTYADADALASLLESERIDAILHCAARSLVGESIADPSTLLPRQRRRRGRAPRGRARRAGRAPGLLLDRGGLRGPGRDADPRGRPAPADQPVRRVEAHVRGRPRLVRPSVRPAQRLPPLLQRGRRDRGARRGPRPRDPPHPERPRAPPKATASITIFGDDYPTPDGTCIRDYIHVADLADAHLRAIEATAPGDPRTTDALVCNLGNGGGFSVREVLAAAEAVVGRPIPSTVGPRRPGDPPVLVARADRAAELLGWRPAHPSLEEIVGSAWAWRLSNTRRATTTDPGMERPPALPV